MEKLRGWIIYNGNLQPAKFMELAVWIDQVANKRGLQTEIVRNNDLLISLENGQAKIKGQYEGVIPDFVIFFDKDIYLARHLEKMGIKLYNNASSIEITDDKAFTYQILSNNDIPMPKTIIAPKIFNEIVVWDSYEKIADVLGFPMVLKETFGSFGQQVYLVQNYEEMIARVKEIGSRPYLFQELVKSSYGRDIRLQVVGNKVVTAVLRTSNGDFRANVSNGGTMHTYTPTKAEEELAGRTAKLVGTDFAGIDILFGDDEEPIICEVNSNAHFKNLYECTGVDVAESIVEHILKDFQ